MSDSHRFDILEQLVMVAKKNTHKNNNPPLPQNKRKKKNKPVFQLEKYNLIHLPMSEGS